MTIDKSEEIHLLKQMIRDIYSRKARGTNAADAIPAIKRRIKELGGDPNVVCQPH